MRAGGAVSARGKINNGFQLVRLRHPAPWFLAPAFHLHINISINYFHILHHLQHAKLGDHRVIDHAPGRQSFTVRSASGVCIFKSSACWHCRPPRGKTAVTSQV